MTGSPLRSAPAQPGDAAWPSLANKVRALARAEAYPEPTTRVETRETHMAWVFLTDTHAYKLKKPVRYSYLDYSTAAARERMCREELRLNRRLAPEVYLAVVPLAAAAGGGLEAGGDGPAVDWLVRMRRLPAAGFLDKALAAGAAEPARLAAAARHLVRFYRRAQPVGMSAADYRERLRAEIAEERRELAAGGHVPPARAERLCTALEDFLARRGRLFDERVAAGRIVEGHGDLRPEHVHLGPPPAVIDALEFNRDFRLLDPVDELAYLGMECERLGDAEIGAALRLTYREELDDPFPVPLLYFHKARRACLRAKLALWHLHDAETAEPAKWPRRAAAYLRLAERYLPRFAHD